MKKAIRLAVVAGVSVIALAFTGSALAAYTSPTLVVDSADEKLGGGAPLTIRVSTAREDDATFKVTIYAPQGYVSSTVQPAGTQIGTAEAQAQAGPTSDVILPLAGTIRTADPAPYRASPQSQACAGGATIDAVWIISVTVAGQPPFDIPMYVTTITSGAEASFASVKLQVCLASPYVPESQGGARLGAKLLNATLRLNGGIFTNPNTAGDYRWRALFTPYTVGSASPNALGTVETQSVQRIPVQLVLNGRANHRTNRITLSGRFTERGLGIGSQTVALYRGKTARGVKVFKRIRTRANGSFSTVVRLKPGMWFFRARAVVGLRTVNGCEVRTNPAITCLRTTYAPATVFNNTRLRVRLR